ncbi:GAF domain-containing sensor histidine kinase [Cohnella terricola]|uniref:histidine kinase n=1 Tax=Cohnella terricola TaxID=1289167 RepID=A0A559JWG6_9BACL|nr:GAF domain-containing sensor histidine kinase [Cohnella terricola]TVY04231.1 GAF domain-containing sensor histidine kinase [Cohnella terricola]
MTTRYDAQEPTRIQALSSMAIALSETLNLDDLLYNAVNKCVEILEYDAAALYLLGKDKRMFIAEYLYGFPEQTKPSLKEFPIIGLTAQVVKTGKTIVVPNVEPHHERRPYLSEFKSCIIVPVKVRKETVGVFLLHSKSSRQFVKDEILLIESIGLQIGVASENARMFESMRRSRRLNAQLLAAQINAQEKERERIASDIHDSINQSMVGIHFHLQYCLDEKQCDPDQIRPILSKLLQTTEKSMMEFRQIINDLHPVAIQKFGFLGALEELISSVSIQNALRIEMFVTGEPARFRREVEISLYRIFQESINNIVKHAKASHAELAIHFGSDYLKIRIRDYGAGFVTTGQAEHGATYGLIGMKRRVEELEGRFAIDGEASPGTRIDIVLDMNRLCCEVEREWHTRGKFDEQL